jgi:membrane protease YdiL (CAAX protease family)
MNPYKAPQIESNWWRIVLYLFLWIIGVFLFSIPAFIFFSDFLEGDIPDVLMNHLGYQSAIQLAMALGAIGASWLMIKEIEYRNFSFYRLTFVGKLLIQGFAIGVIMMLLFSFLVDVLGIIEFNYVGLSTGLLISFFLYLFVAVAEEVLVRGYILTNLQEKMSPFLALVVSSLFFGSLHLGNHHFSWIGFATISLSGFLMGLLTLKTGSVSTAVGLHWSWNFVQGPVLGFAVSGHQESGVLTPIAFSSDLLSGGKFGAEGSIVLMIFSLFSAIGGCYFFFGKKFFFGSKRLFTNPEFSEEK